MQLTPCSTQSQSVLARGASEAPRESPGGGLRHTDAPSDLSDQLEAPTLPPICGSLQELAALWIQLLGTDRRERHLDAENARERFLDAVESQVRDLGQAARSRFLGGLASGGAQILAAGTSVAACWSGAVSPNNGAASSASGSSPASGLGVGGAQPPPLDPPSPWTALLSPHSTAAGGFLQGTGSVVGSWAESEATHYQASVLRQDATGKLELSRSEQSEQDLRALRDETRRVLDGLREANRTQTESLSASLLRG